ncbi:hypothetical protein MSIMFB_03530 [Mycobacterium simulans]|uniref:Uncharacterized protein n=1 Tax=Mycobacterium simulans TaxID=627089 RepID=A0A7Z7IM07_9MYCO|nr:hypothetical protein [Mycobacterium simulans]SOJ56054.1 hypothetical protein MSIMFB_03530 [Mycobacterium simulans]
MAAHRGSPVKGSLAQQVQALVTDPIVGGPAIVEAIDLAVRFYGTNPPSLQHISYQSVPAVPGQSSIAVAIGHMNHIAGMTLARTL